VRRLAGNYSAPVGNISREQRDWMSFSPLECDRMAGYTACSAVEEAPMPSRIEESLRLVRAEYREMPGLNLTKRQAERLWSFDESTCEEVFRTLEAEHVLQRTLRDGYVLARDGY
jgi:hypothetical protein